MEHADRSPITVGKEIQGMDRSTVERELRAVHSLPTSGTTLDLKERLARAREKNWLPPQPSQANKDTKQSNTGLTEEFLLISSVINTITDSS